MVIVGMDLHKKESQLCVLNAETGEIEREERIPTSREAFREFFGRYKKCEVLMEASTESQWAAPCLRKVPGVSKVIVADPNDASMYGKRGRTRQKTDKRDAAALALSCLNGTYSKAHEASEASMKTRQEVNGRGTLVHQRTMLVNDIQSMMRAAGVLGRIAGERAVFSKTLRAAVAIPKEFKTEVEPLLLVLDAIQISIEAFDRRLEEKVKKSAEAKLLLTIPGIGPLTAMALLAQFDGVGRFPDARKVAAYLGLVPKADGSGESDGRMGGITKAGNPYVRGLLTQCAMSLMRSKTEESAGLRSWVGRIRQKKGTQVAAVALARRLSRIAYACLRDKKGFTAEKCASKKSRTRSKAA